jgi:hypothetical protein
MVFDFDIEIFGSKAYQQADRKALKDAKRWKSMAKSQKRQQSTAEVNDKAKRYSEVKIFVFGMIFFSFSVLCVNAQTYHSLCSRYDPDGPVHVSQSSASKWRSFGPRTKYMATQDS